MSHHDVTPDSLQTVKSELMHGGRMDDHDTETQSCVKDEGGSATASPNTSTVDSSTSTDPSANDSSTLSAAGDATGESNTKGEEHQCPAANKALEALLDQVDNLPPLEWSEDGVKQRELTDHYHTSHPHTLKRALYSTLCEQKEGLARRYSAQIAQSRCWLDKVTADERRQQTKLTNLLIREGVVPPVDEVGRADQGSESVPNTTVTSVVVDMTNEEEVERVNSLHHDYEELTTASADERERLISTLRNALLEQSYVRPVTEQDITASTSFLRHKFTVLEGQLKLVMCQLALASRSQAAESRHNRHRRNFPKEITAVLNAHFFAHLDDQYPSEAVKRQLAAQCGLSAYQVSNWFGNKRVRYRKSVARREKMDAIDGDKSLPGTRK